MEDEWSEHVNWVKAHLAGLKEGFRDDPRMIELLGVVDKIINGDFEFTQNPGDGLLLVEGVVALQPEPGTFPNPEAIQVFLLDTYPGIIYNLFVLRVEEYLSQEGLYLPTHKFGLLRETLTNLEMIGRGEMPYSVEMVGKGNKLIFRLPLEIETEGRAATLSLTDAAVAISQQLPQVFKKIKELTVTCER